MSTIEVIFLILDVIEIIALITLISTFRKRYKKYQERSVMSIAGLALTIAFPGLFTFLVILFAVLFLAICEMAYKVYEITNRPIVSRSTKTYVPYEIYHYEGQLDQQEQISQDEQTSEYNNKQEA